ncbi:MAG: hypothetical protein ACI8XC_004033 [Gammaproteobacteria bacterium]|jgi:hypothetical protein
MSKININEVDSYFEDSEEYSDTEFGDHSNKKLSLQIRRKIEYHNELKKIRAMMDTEDSYWGD